MNRVHTLHPVYRSMNKPLMILGDEGPLFLLALVIGTTTRRSSRTFGEESAGYQAECD